MDTYRVLITGSRDWTDAEAIEMNLIHAAADALNEEFSISQIVLVSGACPTGADLIGEEIASRQGWQVERHPAVWKERGRRAGFVRNSYMVSLGAEVCLAFIKNNSKGASMTARIAEEAGIETRIVREN